MIASIRDIYNEQFTAENYRQFLEEIDALHSGALDFRIAETPVFVPKEFTAKMIDTCESIVNLVLDPAFKVHTDRAIPEHLKVPNENDHPHFIAFDFGICENSQGEREPQLVEMQGFASLFAFQAMLAEQMEKHFTIPSGFTPYFGNYHKESYLDLLTEILTEGCDPGEVVLLDLFPEKQKTRIDFYLTRAFTGIGIACLTDLVREGNQLYYYHQGKKTGIRRIYNRIIFDELLQQSPQVQEKGKILFGDLDVEWVPHPSWFYRISKFTLPFIHHPYVPETFFLNEITQLPPDLENYVLKPLFSFSGRGVMLDLTLADIERVTDPENRILQRKVTYANCIKTPDGFAKAEIRIFYFWKKGWPRPLPVHNLARITKGSMIGVSYNKDKTWVGGSVCFSER